MEVLDYNGNSIKVGSIVTKINDSNKRLYRINRIIFNYGEEPDIFYGDIRRKGKELEVEYLTKSEEILFDTLIKNNYKMQITRQELENLVERIAIRYIKEQQEDID